MNPERKKNRERNRIVTPDNDRGILESIPGGGGLPCKKDGGSSSYLSGVKKAVLVPLRMFILNRSTAGACAVPFGVLSLKKSVLDNLLF